MWDCSSCGKTNIRASIKECPGCGSPQGEDTVFRLPNQISYVSEEKAKTISRRPDWQCSYCEQLNRDSDNLCKGCGASKTESTQNYFQMKRNAQSNNQSDTDPHITNTRTTNSYTAKSKKRTDSNKTFIKYAIAKGAVIAVSILSVITLIALLIIPKEQIVDVNGFEWSRSIAIEEYQTVEESDWNLPSNARLLYSQEELRGYDKVLDHYETVTKTESRQVIDYYETVVVGYRDLGNGYFEEQTRQQPVYKTEYYTVTEQEPVYVDVPIYDTKYYYEIDKWIVIRHVTTNGTDKKPYWGDTALKADQREGNRSETFKIICTDKDDKTYTYVVNESDWNDINVGDKLKIKVNALGIISEIEFVQ